MLKPEQINAIIQQVADLLKAYYGLSDSDKKKKLPDYNPIYADTVQLQQEVAVHCEIRDFPEKLFKAKAPNESDEQWRYRRENYQPVTMPFWNRALAVMNRVWNENNYELKWPEKEEEQKKYFAGNYPQYKSLIAFFESVVTRYKVNDPNAVIVIKPWYLPTAINEQGEIIIADNQEIDAIAEIYSADKVIKFERDYCMILTDEKSQLKYNNQVTNDGLVFEIYDDTEIYKVVQHGKKIDWTFKWSVFYSHQLGYIPAQKLRGMPLNKDGNIIYKSMLYDAVPLLNEALYDYSTSSIVKAGAAFPIRWAFAEICRYMGPAGERCDGGKISVANGDSMKQIPCPECHGTGTTNPYTPGGLMNIALPGKLDGDKAVPTPPLGFVSADVNILKYLGEECYTNIIRAFSMLNIDLSNSSVKGSATALGKQIDREELFSFIQIFSSEIFDLLDWTYDSIGRMRFTTTWKKPVISKPVNFAIRSEADITEEIAKGKEMNMPDVALRRLMQEYMTVRFTDSAEAKAIIDLTMKVDGQFAYDPTIIMAGLGSGYLQKWEAQLHKNIVIYIDEEIEANPNFMQLKFDEQRKALVARAKSDVEANSPLKAENILTTVGGA